MGIKHTILLLQTIFCCALSLTGFPSFTGYAANHTAWGEVGPEIRDRSRDIRKSTALTEDLVTKGKQALKKTLNSLQENVKSLESGLKDKQQRLSELESKEQTLRQDLKEELDAVKGVQSTVLSNAEDLQSLIREAPPGGLQTNLDAAFLKALDKQEAMPGMQEIRTLVDALFAFMETSEGIVRFEGSFLKPDGEEARGEIVRIGGIEALFCSEEECGFLQSGSSTEMPRQAAGRLSWFTRREIRAYINGEDGHAPVDVSKGILLQRLAGEKTWTEWIREGGLLIWAIFGVALLALILGLERLFFVLRIRSNSDRIMQTITALLQEGRWKESLEFCRRNRNSPTSQILARGLECIGQSKQILDNAMQEALLKLLPRLERFLPTLSVLAAVAPLLGLLGTVTGMISTFQTITIFGTADPKHMAGGISEALITTQAGLMVAVPIMFLHHLLDRRIDKILGDIEEKGARLSLLLLQKGQVEDQDDAHA